MALYKNNKIASKKTTTLKLPSRISFGQLLSVVSKLRRNKSLSADCRLLILPVEWYGFTILFFMEVLLLLVIFCATLQTKEAFLISYVNRQL